MSREARKLREALRVEPLSDLLSEADVDDLIVIDPYNGDPPSKRKDSELARTLAILDELKERGKE